VISGILFVSIGLPPLSLGETRLCLHALCGVLGLADGLAARAAVLSADVVIRFADVLVILADVLVVLADVLVRGA